MVRRRTRALINLAITLPPFVFILWLWKFMWDHEEQWDDPIPVSPVDVTIGLLSGSLYGWFYDRDVAQIRTSLGRRFVAQCFLQGWQRLLARLSPDGRTTRYNVAVGMILGLVGYRLWYGVLHPLPGDE